MDIFQPITMQVILTVFCTVHGTSNSNRFKTIMPEYNKGLEKPFSSSYMDYRNKIIKENIKEKKINDLVENIKGFISSSDTIYTEVILIIIVAAITLINKKLKILKK